MLELQLRQQLATVALRFVRLKMWRQLTWLWAAFSLMVLIWVVCGRPLVPTAVWFCSAGIVAIAVWIRARSSSTSRTEIARRIEQAFPDLNSRLLAAIEQSPDIESGRLNVMQRQLIAEAIHHARMNDWTDAISHRCMRKAFWGQTAALAIFCIVGMLAMQATSRSAAAKSRFPFYATDSAQETPVTVEPGNAELERGTSLLIFARFAAKPPADVKVAWKGPSDIDQQIPLTKSLDDPVFATRFTTVNDDMTYHIEFDGHRTADYRITVYDLPALIRSDMQFQFPGYTGLEEKSLTDAFEASVVEGTQITITCRTNKPVTSARLVSGDETTFDLQKDPGDPTSYQVRFTPSKKMRLKLDLIDDSGRRNRNPEEFRIDVVPNRPPEIKLVFPGKDVKVSPLEEIQIEATVFDDFAVVETGLFFQTTGRDPIKLSLGQDLKGGQPHRIQTLQRLEDFRVQPDELVSYYFFAVDIGPDGQRRLTNSDMFFAEVRSFDEIYRQVDQQGAGEMQSSQKPPDSLAKLLELQKQIIVATWKLARLINPSWGANSTEQVKTIHEGQSQAILKLQSLRERMSQPQLQPLFSSIADGMQKAQDELGRSLAGQSLELLGPAIVHEQAAYQNLLKLRAKEHLLMQSKAKGNGQENEEKEKLDLELKRNTNRYESEKQGAKKEESNINRQALAILDRLKELANRQDEINEQIKQLESQMRQAKTDADREEIERRLKRLREEQQQLLHDADELRNKLNNTAQHEMVAEAKQQLEQTRQHLVDTAEKLREGQLSQALASGTRAERELKQLHEDFRKQTAALFADTMRKLRDEARQLADREKQLRDQLNHLGEESRHTLRQSKASEQLQAEFQQQRQQVNEIVDKARQVVEQSEVPEPLLSRQLYETLRSSRESKLDQALAATQQLLKQGVVAEATKAEQQASTGIDQLKKGIEKAAESVLGNEVESLKRARRELAELSDQLDKEIQSKSQDEKSDMTGNGSQSSPGQERDEKGTASGLEGKNGEKPAGPGGKGNKTADGSNSADQSAEAGSPSSSDSKADGNPESQGQGNSQGNGAPNSDQGDAAVNSDATSPTIPKQNEDGQADAKRGPQSLRPSKSSGGAKPGRGQSNTSTENSDNGGTAGNGQGGGPLTGGNYAEFNERLREVESMISDPQLQAEVQKVRDRARSARAEFKRHTQTPNWGLVRTSVHQPMVELQQRLTEEIAKRESPDSLVPVDRDPVPTKYRDLVRSYYERLGSGKEE